MNKIDPAEIRNPKLTLERREREAGLTEPPVGGMTPRSTEQDPTQGRDQFFYPPGRKPRDRNPEGLRKLLEEREKRNRRAREAPQKTSSADDAFEEEFRRGTDDPLTDSVRAARKAAGADRRRDMAEYEAAYNA